MFLFFVVVVYWNWKIVIWYDDNKILVTECICLKPKRGKNYLYNIIKFFENSKPKIINRLRRIDRKISSKNEQRQR